MLKKFLLVVIFFSSCNIASAEIFINEVEISPIEERFIELYNYSDEAVDLTGWYIQRKTATGSAFGSLVSKTNFEGKTIGANSFFVISRNSLSNSNIVLSTLTLTESNTIQIKKSEKEVIDKIGWGSSNDCSDVCPPNPSEGRSIQKTATGWLMLTPTPGVLNRSTQVDDNSTENAMVSNNNEETSPAPASIATVNDTAVDEGSNTSTTPQKAEEPPVVITKTATDPAPLIVSGTDVKEEVPIKSVGNPLPEIKKHPAKVKIEKSSPAPLSNLTANATSSEAVKEDPDNSFLWMIITFVFIAGCAGAVYFIRQKKVVNSPGDDFDILEG